MRERRSGRSLAILGYHKIGEPPPDGWQTWFYVPTDYIGGINDFDAGEEPEEAICDWDDLRELERSGVSIQSHGASHRSFSKLSLPEQEEELAKSKITLEAGLEKPVEVFAYPYGDSGTELGSTVRALERAEYRAACLYN